jgi:hypothetical protein
VNGGIWIPGGGRHNRGAGYLKDIEKKNEANILGWHVYEVTPQDIYNLKVIALLQRAFKK